MSGVSCHVLDTSLGRPARGMAIQLHRSTLADGEPGWQLLSRAVTNADGRVVGLEGPLGLSPGLHRISFETEGYLRAAGHPVFYPVVHVCFEVTSATEHHHIPLLLSPFGYSTYRGS